MSDWKKLIDDEFIETIKDKKLVMSPSMFINEISEFLVNCMILSKRFDEGERENLKLWALVMTKAQLRDIWEANINSKPTDPEDIQ